MSRSHPILFSGEMVEAIFAGRKTQTRRLAGLEVINQETERYEYVGMGGESDDPLSFDDPFLSFYDKKADVQVIVKSRYGGAGHLLWVREKWQAQNLHGAWWHEVKREERSLHNWAFTNPIRPAYEKVPPRWLPGIHMPRMACRLWLDVKGLRAERVGQISYDDAAAEGMNGASGAETYSMFADLWERLNGNWLFNPWVMVVEFGL